MKKFSQIFFSIGTFVFLYWYMPMAVSDDMVTLTEIAMIGINLVGFMLNFTALVASGFERAG